MTEWQDCFVFVFLILCSCPESQRLHQSLFHLPVSTLALSSLQDTPVLTLPSSSLPYPWLHTDNMMVKGGGRFFKKGAPKTERLRALWTVATEQLLAASGNVKAQHFFTEETPHFHGRWNLERQTQRKGIEINGESKRVPLLPDALLLLQPLISSVALFLAQPFTVLRSQARTFLPSL